MEITQQLLSDIREKALAIGELRGYKEERHGYTYVSIEKQGITIVYRDSNYNESDDIYEVYATVEELNSDMDALLAKKRKEEEEARIRFQEQQVAREKEQKEYMEKKDKAEWKRLRKKYGS